MLMYNTAGKVCLSFASVLARAALCGRPAGTHCIADVNVRHCLESLPQYCFSADKVSLACTENKHVYAMLHARLITAYSLRPARYVCCVAYQH